MNEPVDPRSLRASDADRDKIAELLREAAGEGRLSLEEVDERLEGLYQARTYAELETFTSDLPANYADQALATSSSTRAPASSISSRIGGTPGSKVSIAVLSGATRKGPWVVPPAYTAVAFWGGADLDLREAKFSEREVTIRAFAVMGGIDITVPHDVDVVVEGFAFMGGFEDSTHSGGQVSGNRPVVRITGFAFWGGVDVKRKRREGEQKELDKE